MLKRISYSFTRPSDTTAYASADLVANSTTAASVVPMSFNVGGGGGKLVHASFANNRTTITNATFSLHLYGSTPVATAPTNGDNGALAVISASKITSLDFAIMVTSLDVGRANLQVGATGFLYPIACPFAIVYGLIEAKAAYTPASAEVFTCSLTFEK